MTTLNTVTLFTRQRTADFDPTSRELVWASEGTYAHTEEYGNHMYQLEVALVGTPMEYLESQDSVPAGYTYGVRGAAIGGWYCFRVEAILSCTYVGEMGVVDYTSPEELLLMVQHGPTPLFKLKKLDNGNYSFRLDGTVVIDLNNKVITTPDDWDEDDWDTNKKLITYLTNKLFK